MQRIFLIGVALAGIYLSLVKGHGRLIEPASRSSLWRLPEYAEWAPQENFLDNQLFCGGVDVQYNYNNGRCGECGDPYNSTRPRENENTGIYGRGIVARTYRRGQVVDVDVEITASHWGYFRFSICPLEHPYALETEECFDENVLQLADGSGTDLQGINTERHYYTQVVLPPALTCERCVFRWHYHTGNTWGNCGNGTEGIGCGQQEEFRGCADVSIIP